MNLLVKTQKYMTKCSFVEIITLCCCYLYHVTFNRDVASNGPVNPACQKKKHNNNRSKLVIAVRRVLL